jgi:hypothetical protein
MTLKEIEDYSKKNNLDKVHWLGNIESISLKKWIEQQKKELFNQGEGFHFAVVGESKGNSITVSYSGKHRRDEKYWVIVDV